MSLFNSTRLDTGNIEAQFKKNKHDMKDCLISFQYPTLTVTVKSKHKHKIDITHCTLQRSSPLIPEKPETNDPNWKNLYFQINFDKDTFVFYIPNNSQFINMLTVLGLNMKVIGTYGYPLRVSVLKSAWRFPTPIFRSIQYLRYNEAHFVQGIFRTSCKETERERVRLIMNTDLTAETFTFKGVHVAAGVLKEYLRTLDEPIFPMEFNDKIKACALEENNVFIKKMKKVINELPSINKNCLWYIFDYLNLVVKHNEVNLMNAENLSIVFGPSLIYTDISNTSEKGKNELNEFNVVIKRLIENYGEIFREIKMENEGI
ncbi:hypothetical protein EIN_017710 [Entamoeba invadens IP1]|uniref:hypothetical protein n=1 Tax=Entamoeba invadens IP1 TaxID=370355 RepID=UPI0002C3DAC9|nr:hypothetical protein EIN_017710 [Entamoeba invadens IP1]ELP90462.1 hypothetical protein EIN_017710 [Entamoeba invadens IP1]|eukprot:XP_004257233.1 hypothetical protein EIN_017710 [Entamoeba invadens IP1]